MFHGVSMQYHTQDSRMLVSYGLDTLRIPGRSY